MDPLNHPNVMQEDPAEVTRPASEDVRAVSIPLDKLRPNPDQPRAFFDEVEQRWLTESVAKEGVLQPILVRAIEGGEFMIVAGERRFKAAQAAGLRAVPAIVVDGSKDGLEAELAVQRLALVENLQRSDLNDYELAVGVTEHLARVLGLGSRDEVARLLRRMLNDRLQPGEESLAARVDRVFRQLGRNRVSFTTNQLMVLSLHGDLQAQLRSGNLDLSKARLLNRIKDDEVRRHMMWNAIHNKWTTAVLRREIADLEVAKERTLEGERRRAEIAKRMTAVRASYVKHRRRLPPEALGEVEEALARIDSIIASFIAGPGGAEVVEEVA